MPKFNPTRAAAVLVEASLSTDAEVAKRFRVSVRSIEAWRVRLKSDAELKAEYEKVAAAKLSTWLTKIPSALDAAIGFINRAAAEGDPTNPEMVAAITGAIVQLNEVLIVQQAVELRKNQTYKANLN